MHHDRPRDTAHAALALGIVVALAGCGGGHTSRGAPWLPLSRQVTFVESTGTGETMLRATGKGTSVPRAMADAKKAALWFLLYAGDRPLLMTSRARELAKKRQRALFEGVDEFVRYESRLMSKRRVGRLTHVDIVFRFDVASIKRRLERDGVSASDATASERAGLPTIAVLTEHPSAVAQVAVTTFQEYLQDRGFEVFQLSDGKQDRAIADIAALEGVVDPAWALAMGAQSDIYVKVDVSSHVGRRAGVPTKKATVSVTAYETATRRSVGANVGHSPERVVADFDAITQEAANDAADKLTSQIRRAWSAQLARGRPFKVVAMADGGGATALDGAVYRALKKLSRRAVKRLGAGSGLSSYLVWVKGVDNAFELFGALRRSWRGPGELVKVRDAGSLLIIKGGEDDGVEIELQ